jgi:signal peptidase II
MADSEKEPSPEAKVEGPSPYRRQWILFAIVMLLSLAADQATKIWARDSLPTIFQNPHVRHPAGAVCEIPEDLIAPDENTAATCRGEAVTVIGGFWDWRLSMNSGSAFGLFSGQKSSRIFLSLVGIVAVFGMLWMLRKARPDQRILHWALALVAGGAIGNLIDRIYYGVVTDFVLWRYKTHEWPVFNVADIVLVVGVGLMFIDIQKEGKKDKAAKKARSDKARAAGLVKDMRE